MSMEVVAVRNLSARATRARLMTPPGGRNSSELEVIPAYLARAGKAPALPVTAIPAPPPLTQEQIDRDRRSRETAFIEAWTFTKTKTIRAVITAAKMHFDRSEAALFSHRRTTPIVRARQIMMYLAKEHTLLSLPQIGQRLGGFDHTTVLHGVRRIAELLAAGDKAVTYDFAHMENMLGIR